MTDLKDQFFDFVNIFFFFCGVFGGLCRLFLCCKSCFMIGFIAFLWEKNKKKVTNKCELRNHLCKDVGVRYLYSKVRTGGSFSSLKVGFY